MNVISNLISICKILCKQDREENNTASNSLTANSLLVNGDYLVLRKCVIGVFRAVRCVLY